MLTNLNNDFKKNVIYRGIEFVVVLQKREQRRKKIIQMCVFTKIYNKYLYDLKNAIYIYQDFNV
jgi:hypothetical protein